MKAGDGVKKEEKVQRSFIYTKEMKGNVSVKVQRSLKLLLVPSFQYYVPWGHLPNVTISNYPTSNS